MYEENPNKESKWSFYLCIFIIKIGTFAVNFGECRQKIAVSTVEPVVWPITWKTEEIEGIVCSVSWELWRMMPVHVAKMTSFLWNWDKSIIWKVWKWWKKTYWILRYHAHILCILFGEKILNSIYTVSNRSNTYDPINIHKYIDLPKKESGIDGKVWNRRT